MDSGFPIIKPVQPTWRLDEFSVFVFLGIFSKMPNRPIVRLGKKDNLGLHQFGLLERLANVGDVILIPTNNGFDTGDLSGLVGDREDDPMGFLLPFIVQTGTGPGELRPGLQRKPFIGAGGGMAELGGGKIFPIFSSCSFGFARPVVCIFFDIRFVRVLLVRVNLRRSVSSSSIRGSRHPDSRVGNSRPGTRTATQPW